MPEKARPYSLPGQWLRSTAVHCLASCRAAAVAPAAETLPPHSPLVRTVSFSHGSAGSNTAASAHTRFRLSACRGRASLRHRFASARAVSVRRASALAQCVAQLQLVRTGRKRRTISWHRGGPPHNITLNDMLTRVQKWTFGDTETLVYLAALLVGVPLTTWELWNLGRTSAATALACLWVPTVGTLVVDFKKGQVSRASALLFFAWMAVGIGSGIYAYVV